jgi:signal transduction histidine kinase
VAPLLIGVLLVIGALGPVRAWLAGQDSYDEAALREWLEESRFPNRTLAHLIDRYFENMTEFFRLKHSEADPIRAGSLPEVSKAFWLVSKSRLEISEHLRALGEPPTKQFGGQLPLFPLIYRLEVSLDCRDLPEASTTPLYEDKDPAAGEGSASDSGTRKIPTLADPISWDSMMPSQARSGPPGEFPLHPKATVRVWYQLHAFAKRQKSEQDKARQLWQLSALAIAATALALAWLFLVQNNEQEQERQRLLARQQVEHAERLRAETERELLEQRFATQSAERKALELKSQLYVNIGIMAGSYAHNIKNLLVRPNDLLRRCLADSTLPGEVLHNLEEADQILDEVTKRLEQILATVRRDPTRSERVRLDLAATLRQLVHTWKDLARINWQADLDLELPGGEEPLPLEGDLSHLQQAVENLLFNARDATREMRDHLRDQVHRNPELTPAQRRQALIEANRWRGRIVVRAFRAREGSEPGRRGSIVVEVSDNGIGMTESVRRQCTEAHFSTKRDNALFHGQNTGMGLGLSFVAAILENHQARLEIDSEPLRGTTFRVIFASSMTADDKVTR